VPHGTTTDICYQAGSYHLTFLEGSEGALVPTPFI